MNILKVSDSKYINMDKMLFVKHFPKSEGKIREMFVIGFEGDKENLDIYDNENEIGNIKSWLWNNVK